MSRKIEDLVQDKYGAVANSRLSNRDEGVRAVAHAFGSVLTEAGFRSTTGDQTTLCRFCNRREKTSARCENCERIPPASR
jgi:hypothetical protein